MCPASISEQPDHMGETPSHNRYMMNTSKTLDDKSSQITRVGHTHISPEIRGFEACVNRF